MGRSRTTGTQGYTDYGNANDPGYGTGRNAGYGTGRSNPYAQTNPQSNPYAQASPYAAGPSDPYGRGQRGTSPYDSPSPYARGAVRMAPVSAGHAGRGQSGGPKKSSRVPVIVAGVIALVVLAVAAWFIVGRLSVISVTVNDQPVELSKGATVQSLLDKGYATPQPGNLLAVDGSVFTPGA